MWLRARMEWRTYMAGRFALIFIASISPITNASLTADINIASAINYVSRDRPDKNVEHLVTHAEEAMNHAAGADYLWVVNSAAHIARSAGASRLIRWLAPI